MKYRVDAFNDTSVLQRNYDTKEQARKAASEMSHDGYNAYVLEGLDDEELSCLNVIEAFTGEVK